MKKPSGTRVNIMIMGIVVVVLALGLAAYMACGMPVIAAAEGETARIIKESECGLCCDLGNAQQLGLIIREMMQSDLKIMGEKSRR